MYHSKKVCGLRICERVSKTAQETKKMRYYLAIDIGASSGRHILAYLENGKMITGNFCKTASWTKTATSLSAKAAPEPFPTVNSTPAPKTGAADF